MEAKIIACALIGIFSGPIFSLAVTPIFCLLRTIFYVPFIRKKLLEKAKQQGHIFEATLKKSYDVMEDGLPTAKEIGVYRYQYKGKTRKYRAITITGLKKTITLYYIKNPKRATVANDLGNWEIPWFRSYLIISLIITVGAFIAGMIIL